MDKLTKDPNSLNTALQDTFAKMSISHKYRLVGSSNLLDTIHTTDFDLQDLVEDKSKDEDKVYDKIYEFFVHLFTEFKKDADTYITDLKCGLSGDEPIRWKYDIILKNRNKFIKALKQKSRIKLDVVYHLNNEFVEVSMIYYIRVGKYQNYTEEEFSKEFIVKELKKDIILYKKEGNYLKVLKRKFSMFKQLDQKVSLQNKLLEFFNSPVGIMYKAVGDLKTILLLYEQDFRKVPQDEIYAFQQIIKSNLNMFNLPKIFKMLDKSKLTVKQIDSVITQLIKLINKECVAEFGFLLNGSV
jgi:hypothetical protein